MNTQINIFELVSFFDLGGNQGSYTEDSLDGRQQTEEVITDLFRKKRVHLYNEKKEFLDGINPAVYFKKSNALDRITYVLRCVHSMIRFARKNIFDSNYEFHPEVFLKLFPGCQDQMEITVGEEFSYEILSWLVKGDLKGVVCIKSPLEKESVYMPCGDNVSITKKKCSSKFKLKGDTRWIRVEDGPRYFSMLVLMCQLKEIIQLQLKEEEDITNNVFYAKLLNVCKDRVKQAEDRSEIIKLPEEVLGDLLVNEVFFESDVVPYANLGEKNSLNVLFPLFYMSPSIELNVFNTYELSSYESIETVVMILDLLLEQYEEYTVTEKEMRRYRKEYAHSFETKNNIPVKIMNAMKASEFNEIFGYVEFDEDCDIKKMDQICKEYQKLSKFLSLPTFKAVSLRFRKLGQHKARGLYFPNLRCLCVDLKSPSSFMHEVFHMIDYENGKLSDEYDFLALKECYINLLMQQKEEMSLKLTGKYDMDYYKRPSEIFARCGEIYLARFCGIRVSILQDLDSDQWGYPDSIELNTLITRYYEHLIKRLMM